ncbi:FAD-dependent monooxygenase [Rhodococcus opacus]|uniref:FAD-dependent monooxygenase n=1 Tax=Rhodococcus opacus TaxID=37919 RepID=UPI001C4619D2|nr:FAD-dependent monooxygenase [Rhodococcus opacus]MBV6760422.1 FAD-dependent monooxygenase [Rhodococcus opacus]
MVNRSVVVAGGGPAGLACAIALREKGFDVRVVEQREPGRAQGSELLLPVMVHPVLRSLGVYSECLDAGVPGRAMLLSTAPGADPIKIPLPGTESVAADIPTGIGINRSALHNILWQRAKAVGAILTPETEVVTVDNGNDGGHVTLSDGSSIEYDLLVGADGMFSTIRAAVFPEVERPPLTGQAIWRALVPRTDESLPELLGIYYGPENRKVGIITVGDDTQYLFMSEPAVAEGMHLDASVFAKELRERLGQFDGYVATARESIAEDATISYTRLHLGLVPDPWYRGRAVLVGDAAHGVTPHLAYGAGLSIEDGWVLAESLEKSSSIDNGLAAYVQRRYPRCQKAVEACALLGASELNPEQISFDPMQVTREAWQDLGTAI